MLERLVNLPCSPWVDVSIDVYCNGVSITTCYLVDAFIPQLFDLKRVWLERIALAVFWHFCDHFTWVAKLAHFTWTPGVKISFLIVVHLVMLFEKFVLLFLQFLIELNYKTLVVIIFKLRSSKVRSWVSLVARLSILLVLVHSKHYLN